MNLFKKNETTFAIVCIVIYVVGMSVCQNVFKDIGVPALAECIFGAALAVILFCFANKNGLMEYLGLCRVEKSGKEMLWFIPVIIFTTTNLWTGVALNSTVAGTICGIVSMLFVGFIEEFVFRGLLFKAMAKDNVTSAIIVSSLTFGIGHIVNLLNGAELVSSLLQVVYACAIGFCFVMIFCVGKSIVPCIISHSLFNAFSVVSVERQHGIKLIIICVILVSSLAYGIYLFRIYRREQSQESYTK